MKNPLFRQTLFSWIPLGLAIAMIFFALYITVQHVYRESADDPQTALAERYARLIGLGPLALSTDPLEGPIDIAMSLEPFVNFYDASGMPIAGTGVLGGALPTLPSGIFDAARGKDMHKLTWEPQAGVRHAIVVKPYGGEAPGFVVAGRSLREVEERERALTTSLFLAFIFTFAGSFFVQYFVIKNREYYEARYKL